MGSHISLNRQIFNIDASHQLDMQIIKNDPRLSYSPLLNRQNETTPGNELFLIKIIAIPALTCES